MELEKYFRTLTMIAGRYFIIAGLAFLLFYVVLKKLLAHKKIQQRYPKTADYIPGPPMPSTLWRQSLKPVSWLFFFSPFLCINFIF